MELSFTLPDVTVGGYMPTRRSTSGVDAPGLSYKNLSARLKAAREACGFSQEELARRSGVKRATIAKIESDKVSKPRGLEALAKELNVSPSWLLFGTHEDGAMPTETITLAVAIQSLSPANRKHVEELVSLLGATNGSGKKKS